MLVLMFAGILGGILTAVITSTWLGALGSLVLAPFGGSMMAMAAAVLVALRRSGERHEMDALLDVSTDQQIDALTHVAAPGRALAAQEAVKGRAA